MWRCSHLYTGIKKSLYYTTIKYYIVGYYTMLHSNILYYVGFWASIMLLLSPTSTYLFPRGSFGNGKGVQSCNFSCSFGSRLREPLQCSLSPPSFNALTVDHMPLYGRGLDHHQCFGPYSICSSIVIDTSTIPQNHMGHNY